MINLVLAKENSKKLLDKAIEHARKFRDREGGETAIYDYTEIVKDISVAYDILSEALGEVENTPVLYNNRIKAPDLATIQVVKNLPVSRQLELIESYFNKTWCIDSCDAYTAFICLKEQITTEKVTEPVLKALEDVKQAQEKAWQSVGVGQGYFAQAHNRLREKVDCLLKSFTESNKAEPVTEEKRKSPEAWYKDKFPSNHEKHSFTCHNFRKYGEYETESEARKAFGCNDCHYFVQGGCNLEG